MNIDKAIILVCENRIMMFARDTWWDEMIVINDTENYDDVWKISSVQAEWFENCINIESVDVERKVIVL